MATDPALLEAQAKAGKAGVEAYAEAQATLTSQKQQALAQAMAEAQARGAPGGAMGSLTSTVANPYDAQIRTLAAAQARASDTLARREGTMADYNAAVESARGLIGEQVNLAVAPINANSDFRIRQMQQDSAGKIAQIEAQMRLDAARAAAAAASGGRGGGRGGGGGGGGGSGSKGTLNATELATNLATKAQGNLSAARTKAEQAMRQTAEQSRQAASYAGNSANYSTRQRMEQQAAQQRMAQESARQAAAYTGRSLAAAKVAAPPSVPVPNASPFGAVGNFVPPGQAAQINPNVAGAQEALRKAQEAYNRAAANQRTTATAAQQAQQQNARQIALQTSPLYGAGQSFFTPAQLAGMSASPDMAVYDAMIGASGIQRIGAIGERLGLTPIDASSLPIDRTGGRAYQPRAGDITGMDPTGQESMRRAMQQAAVELADEGYKINQADVDTAIHSPTGDIYKTGDTAYDVQQRMAGGKSYRDQAAERIEEARRYDKDQTKFEIEDEQRQAESIFQQLTGLPAGVVGSQFDPVDLANIVNDPNFDYVKSLVMTRLSEGDEDMAAVWQALREAGEFESRENLAMTRILEAMFG